MQMEKADGKHCQARSLASTWQTLECSLVPNWSRQGLELEASKRIQWENDRLSQRATTPVMAQPAADTLQVIMFQASMA